MEIQDTSVEVLYDFEYATKDGQKVSIKEGEKLLLIKKTNDDWWQVIRSTGRRPFYVPSSYVKESQRRRRDFTVTVSIKPTTTSKVFINCSDDSLTSEDERGGGGGTVLILSGKREEGGDSGYSTVQLSGGAAAGEANLLEEPLSGSLAELAGQIVFAPKARSERDLRRSGSLGGGSLGRRLSESCPEVHRSSAAPRRSRSIADRLESHFRKLSKTNTDTSTTPANERNDSTDSVDSERVGSSSDSVHLSKAKPLPKPRRLQKSLTVECGGEEVIYANCIELAKLRLKKSDEDEPPPGEIIKAPPPAVPAPGQHLPRGWTSHLDTETNQTCYIHSPTGEKWFSSSDAEGRIYYYQENSAESSWTLPEEPGAAAGAGAVKCPAAVSGSPAVSSAGAAVTASSGGSNTVTVSVTPAPALALTTSSASSPTAGGPSSLLQLSTTSLPTPESTQQTVGHELETSKSAVDLASVLARISGIPDHSRRMRSAKTYSMIEHHSYKKDEELSSLAAQKHWPQLSEGKMYVLCEGPLHYTKISESGKRVRKNWTSVYVVLTELFLLIYKDIKAFHSLKTHPELTVDLNGAEVSSGQKVSGRKHVLVVSTLLGLQVALQCETINSALHWATQINTTIANLPKASEVASLQGVKLSSITEGSEDTKKGANIGRSKSVNFKNKDGSMEDLVSSAERQMKIKARLKKFFHKRPTMESLVKKGIWKDEPVFGCYLEQACGSNVPRVPPFVVKCITCIESSQENMTTDGLYRASGNLSQIQKIRLQIDQNNYSVLEKEEDVHVLTGALKLFFRELKEPLIPYKLFPKAIKACMTSNKKDKMNMFSDIVKALPTCNRDTLKFLLQHLIRVTQYQEHNRMHIANVAIVFGPTLMWPEQESINMALDLLQQNMVIENLLSDYSHFFKDK